MIKALLSALVVSQIVRCDASPDHPSIDKFEITWNPDLFPGAWRHLLYRELSIWGLTLDMD